MRRSAALLIAGLTLAGCNPTRTAPAADERQPAQAAAPAQPSTPAPTTPPVVAQEGQNYRMETAGELKIVGTDNQYDIILPTDVLFDFDKAVLRPEADALLAKVKARLDQHGSDQIHVRGYTDAKGSDPYNLTLSINRATAVCRWLKANGHGFTNCIGRGEADPVAPNTNPDGSDNPLGRQQNRRVTISVIKYPDVNAMLAKARSQAQAAKDSLPR